MNCLSKRSTTRLLAPGLILVALATSGCVTKRTVTKGGQTVEEKYVVKRPVKKFINNVEFE